MSRELKFSALISMATMVLFAVVASGTGTVGSTADGGGGLLQAPITASAPR